MTNPGPHTSTQLPLVLRGGFVFDSATRAFERRDLSILGGKIAGADAPVATAIDCAGMYLVPGLIDCHVHVTGSGEPTELNAARTTSLPLRAWKAEQYAKATLHAGITTVRDLGAADRLNIDLARAVESGLVEGPRILVIWWRWRLPAKRPWYWMPMH